MDNTRKKVSQNWILGKGLICIISRWRPPKFQCTEMFLCFNLPPINVLPTLDTSYQNLISIFTMSYDVKMMSFVTNLDFKSICVCKVVNNTQVKYPYSDLCTLKKILWLYITVISVIEVRIHVWWWVERVFTWFNLTLSISRYPWQVQRLEVHTVWQLQWTTFSKLSGCRYDTHHWLETVILAFPTPVWCILKDWNLLLMQ